MRKVSFVLSVFVLLAMLLTACGGQQTSTNIPATNVPPVTVESTATSAPTSAATSAPEMTTTAGVPVTGAENPSRLSNDLKFSVVDQSGNKLGDVSDMVLDLDNTRVSYVVVGSGGALNIGDKKVLIPWASLKLQTGASTSASSVQNAFVLQADPQVLQNAPSVDLNAVIPAMGQAASNWDADIQNYWLSGGSTSTGNTTSSGTATEAPTGAATGSGTATEAPAVNATSTSTSGTGGVVASTATSTSGGTGTSDGNGQGMSLQGVVLASQVLGTTLSLSPGQGNGTGNGTGTGTGTGAATATEAPTSTSGTGAGTGTATEAPTSTSGTGTGTGNGLGNLQATIDDMIVETNTGMIQYLVARTDFGSGEVLVPVPLNLIQWNTTSNGFMLNVAPGVLQTAPNFSSDQFPDTSTSGWDQQFSTFWQSNGGGSSTGTGTGATATATP